MDERIGLVEGLAADQTFLGQPIWVAQRWADSGMPVTREGSPRLSLTRRTEPLAGTRICRGARADRDWGHRPQFGTQTGSLVRP